MLFNRIKNIIDRLEVLEADRHGTIEIQSADFGKGNTKPTQIILGNYTGWEFDINDDSVMDIALPHDVDITGSLIIHISWFVNEAYSTNSAEVQWQAKYSFTPQDGSEALDAPVHTGTLTTGDINIPTTAKTVVHTSNLVIPANIIERSVEWHDIMGLTIKRIALNSGVGPTAKPTVVSVHIEYNALASF